MSRSGDPMRSLGDAFRVHVSESTRERHLAAISTAVRTTPPSRTVKHLGLRRRVATTLAALAAVVAPVGTAVAAEGALPGEVLYPVKQFTERLRATFDDEVSARHRVEELEALLDGDADAASIAEAQTRAEEAVGALDQPGELAGRLERARTQVRARAEDVPSDERPGDADPAGPGERPGTMMGPGPNDDPGPGTQPPGSGDPSDDPDRDRDRDRDGSGDGGGTPSPTTGPGGNDGSGGGSGGDSGGNGSGGDGSGGDGSPGSGSGPGDGGGAGSGTGAAPGNGTRTP